LFHAYFPSGPLDELCPSPENIYCIVFHTILIINQSAFLLSLPFLCLVPFATFVTYVGVFTSVNYLVCRKLNGNIPQGALESTYFQERRQWDLDHPNEEWIFLNGVAVG
jgi:hypothetical protein